MKESEFVSLAGQFEIHLPPSVAAVLQVRQLMKMLVKPTDCREGENRAR